MYIVTKRLFSYVQGQRVKNLREYFYYISHEGYLFLHDARMKNFTSAYRDKDFLNFFYKHLQMNNTGKYTVSFPYLSRCGREQNFLCCDDRPIVFTAMTNDEDEFIIGGSDHKVKIEVSSLQMLDNGRLYHPSSFDSYGLVTSKLADALYPRFSFDSRGQPHEILWKGQKIKLDNKIRDFINKQHST